MQYNPLKKHVCIVISAPAPHPCMRAFVELVYASAYTLVAVLQYFLRGTMWAVGWDFKHCMLVMAATLFGGLDSIHNPMKCLKR